MWGLVGNPEDLFSHNEANISWVLGNCHLHPTIYHNGKIDCDDSIPSCKSDCQVLTISNAVVRPASKVAHGTTVQVVCKGINTLVGESMVTCYDGSYESIPKCVFDISTVKAVYVKESV